MSVPTPHTSQSWAYARECNREAMVVPWEVSQRLELQLATLRARNTMLEAVAEAAKLVRQNFRITQAGEIVWWPVGAVTGTVELSAALSDLLQHDLQSGKMGGAQ